MSSPNFAFPSIGSKFLPLLALVFFALHAAPPAHAQYAESIPYTFSGGSDGASPASALVFDSKGNLYGTAVNGGSSSPNCPGQDPPTGCGVVFELTPPAGGSGPWTETVLYTFQGGSDGAYPQASLIFDSQGNLYGTTSNGGKLSGATCSGLGGCGVVFQLTPPAGGSGSWTETVPYTFQGGNDGAFPWASLIFDSQGNLYGTASGGGSGLNGVVFELSPPSSGHGAWTETPLYSFQGGGDGGSPLANVIFDPSGNLYGTTYTGAHGLGVVFELSPPTGGSGSWTENVLYVFTGHGDGGFPFAGLTFDSNGNLYSTTAIGGFTSGSTCKKTGGCGVVFELSPPSGGPPGSWTETPIYTFTANTDGGFPYAGVIFDSNGNLYGTTTQGGDVSGAICSASVGCGVVFELTPPAGTGSWTESVLYTFNGGSDGGFPYGAPLFDSLGSLYGTTSYGGNSSGSNCVDVGGCGVVFELTPEVGPVVKLSPTSLVFGTQTLDTTSKAKTVTVTNTGSATLNIGSITISANFAISSNTCGANLAVGASCKVKVTFTPTQLGALTGTLTFTDNALNSPQNVQLSGTGVLAVTLTPSSYTYKKTKVGTTSAAKKFTLANNQTVTLTSIVISTTGDFAVSSTTCGTTLASKQKCVINATFTPTQIGKRTGQLRVSDSAPNSPQTASLTGTGN